MDRKAVHQYHKRSQWLLLFSVLIIAICGLIYELVAGTLASYLLGDSVTQFSLIIGIYLFSMGIGSFLSRYFNKQLLEWFIRIELLVGLIGGISAPLLFIAFPLVHSFNVILYALVVLVGTLVGIEIPLLLKILKDKLSFNELVSRVFTFDYIGALLASLVFPLIFVPRLGLVRTSLFFGILNIAVGLLLCFFFQQKIKNAWRLKIAATLLLAAEVMLFAFGNKILDLSDELSYDDHVVFAKTTPYQRLVITRNKNDVRLFINSNLQFSAQDEYRYHEALVHPIMSRNVAAKKVLVLGGGDGLAIREVLKYDGVSSVKLVDLDPEMTKIFSTNKMLTALNDSAFFNKKVTVVNADAYTWLQQTEEKFDCIIVDFPDPSGFAVGKLYTNTFYRELKRHLNPDALFVVQSTSPLVAPRSFWCVDATIQSVGFHTLPYHNYVPSFGEWGYILASVNAFEKPAAIDFKVPVKFITNDVFHSMQQFSPDMLSAKPVEVNKLNNQILVHYFEEEWAKYADK